MAKNKIRFESDEKKSIIIALIVSAVVILSIVLAFVAIKKFRGNLQPQTEVGTENSNASVEIGENGLVVNQEELNEALENPDVISILIETDEELKLVIPSGDYSEKSLFINAANAEVTNYGTFREITIYQIAANTWIENADNNKIKVDAGACHIVIPDGVYVSEIDSVADNSSLMLEITGELSLLSCEAYSANISLDGSVYQVMIYDQTVLTVRNENYMSEDPFITISAPYENLSVTNQLFAYVPVDIVTVNNLDAYFYEKAGSSYVNAARTATLKLKNETENNVRYYVSDPPIEHKNDEELYTLLAPGGEVEVQADRTSLNDDVSGNDDNSSGATTSEESGGNTGNTGSVGSSGSASGSTNNSGSSGTASSSGNKGNSGSTGSSGNSGSSGGVSGYSQAQVEDMIAKAVSQATNGMLTEAEVNAKVEAAVNKAVQEAKAEATKDMISKEDAKEAINNAVAEAVKEAVEKETEAAVEEALKKPMIIAFQEVNKIYAGTIAEPMEYALLKDKLPAEMVGITAKGELISVEVDHWNNYDSYEENGKAIEAREYRFIATLKTSKEFYVASGLMAEVYAYVGIGQTGQAIQYIGEGATSTKVSVDEYLVDNPLPATTAAYYVVTNISEETQFVGLSFTYFDEEGEKAGVLDFETERTEGRYIQPMESWVVTRREPCVGYTSYYVEVRTITKDDEPLQSVVSAETIGEIRFGSNPKISLSRTEEAKTKDLLEATIQILYISDENGFCYGMQQFTTGRRLSNYSGGLVPSIRGTDQDQTISVDLKVPDVDGADGKMLFTPIVTISGGYIYE